MSVKVTNIVIPFQSFRMSVALGGDSDMFVDMGPVRMTGSTICADIATYGSFLQQLGLCNPTTDLLSVVGAANFTALRGDGDRSDDRRHGHVHAATPTASRRR